MARMQVVDLGAGRPIVIIPGIQGRWEWMKPGIDALARHCRVITFSLADEPSARARFDEAAGFANYVRQVRDALDEVRVHRAVICGVSYGGLVATAFAAAHPERASSLVLVSALPPAWKPNRRVRVYLRAPRLLTPFFYAASLRLYREFTAACPGHAAAARAGLRHAWIALTHPLSPTRMARRVKLVPDDMMARVAPLSLPTLVVTGEPSLDRVVPIGLTQMYLALWPHARSATIERTGHLGIVTRPERFAGIVGTFVDSGDTAHPRRQVG